jgi:hypothetical protein
LRKAKVNRLDEPTLPTGRARRGMCQGWRFGDVRSKLFPVDGTRFKTRLGGGSELWYIERTKSEREAPGVRGRFSGMHGVGSMFTSTLKHGGNGCLRKLQGFFVRQ